MTLLFPYCTEENRRKDRSLQKKQQHSGILKGPTTALSHINLPNSLKLCHLTFWESCPWIWGDLSPEFSKRETVHSVVEQPVVAVVVLQIVNKVLQCCKCFQANDKIQHGILNEGYEKTGPKTKYQSALVYLSLFASTQVNQTYCPRITIAISFDTQIPSDLTMARIQQHPVTF